MVTEQKQKTGLYNQKNSRGAFTASRNGTVRVGVRARARWAVIGLSNFVAGF